MLPIGEDFEGKRGTPYQTALLLMAIVTVALYVNGPEAGETAAAVGRAYALTPSRLVADASAWPTLLTYQFLHGGFLHLAANVLFLWVFGRGLEHELRWGFLPFYLFCGAVGGLTSVLLRAGSDVPTVGASGAISGVLAGYLVLHPNANIRAIVLVPWLFVVALLRGERPIWDVPAWAAIVTWFVLQVAGALAPNALRSNVDYGAHIGGFLAGYLIVRVARAWLGLWPDEPEFERVLDRPAARGRRMPSRFVRATRPIPAGATIQAGDVEAVDRSGYIDPDAVPGDEARMLVGRRLREPHYRYEPIRWSDLEPADEARPHGGARAAG